MGIVGATDANDSCPNPTCHVTDHHDSGLTCDAPEVQQINYYPKDSDEAAGAVAGFQNTQAEINRKVLGQYLLTYRASDKSGNQADEIVFSFLFLDPFTPTLSSFKAAEAEVGYTNAVRGWASSLKTTQACNANGKVYDPTCLAISTTENSWGYSYSKKGATETSAAVRGATWKNEKFGDENFSVKPFVADDWHVTAATNEVYASANLESGFCNEVFGEATAWACDRKADATWAFDGRVTPSDNYRSTSSMTVYMKLDKQGTWESVKSIDLCMIGEPEYVVHWYVDDLALAFGYKSNSNPQVHRVQMKVTDNTLPRVRPTKYGQTTGFASIVSGSPGSDETTETTTLECGTEENGAIVEEYVEAGSEVNDNSDGKECGVAHGTVRCIAEGNVANCGITNHKTEVKQGTEGTYNIEYKYTDTHGNPSKTVTRPVTIKDTTVPKLDIKGDCTLENSAGANINEVESKRADNTNANGGLFDSDRIAKMFEHFDRCNKAITTTVTIHTGACKFDSGNTPGVQHCAGDAATQAPIQGNYFAKWTWEGTFNDKGSAATDATQVFPEYEAGTYAIVYKTEDGHFTSTACRQIENVDHTHPIIQILGSDVMTLEATHQGNYIDDGATCSDQVDGVISQNVEVSGDVVNLSKVGTYTITYNCKDSANNAAPAARRTVVVAQTSCPRCYVFGKYEINHEASFPYADAGAACSDVIDGTVSTECYTSRDGLGSDGTPDTVAADCKGSTLVDVETTGTYTIKYRAQNTVGLWNDGLNCRGGPKSYLRTIAVMDTLRPVISLKYKYSATGSDTLVARGTAGNNDGQSDGSGTGANSDLGLDNEDEGAYPGKTNDIVDTSSGAYPAGNLATLYPSWKHGPNAQFKDPETHLPALMAEESTSSVNGWVVGAIASAVAGLALLGYSTRRTAVATSVPV